MARRSNLLLAVALGSILVVFLTLLICMARLKLFVFSGNDSSSKVVVAALALVGTFVTTVVSIVGILLKHSIDQQAELRQQESEKRLKMDSERNAALQRESEQRLKLEAAVRALQLFSTSTGSPTPESQRDGALFALDSLGQYELTLLLTKSLLGKEGLNPDTTSVLLDHAILHGSNYVKNEAITILKNHAGSMITPQGVSIPDGLINWSPDLTDYVREWAPIAISKILLARPKDVWIGQFPYTMYGIIAALCIAWKTEKLPRLKEEMGAILREILNCLELDGQFLYHPVMVINIDEIKKEIAGSSSGGMAEQQIIKDLARWNKSKARAADGV